MTRKLSRRDFLKMAGAATLAVAAMGTLTACGGGGSSTSSDGITMTVKDYRVQGPTINGVRRYFYMVGAEFTNNNSSEYKLENKQFTAKTEAGELPFAYFNFKEGGGFQIDSKTKTLAAKATQEVTLWFETSEDVYNAYKNDNKRVDLVVSRKGSGGQTTTYLIKANGEVVSQ